MKVLLSWYWRGSTDTFLYMLQQVNYDTRKFLSWVYRLVITRKSLTDVTYRKKLEKTKRVKLLKILELIARSIIYVTTVILILINYSMSWSILFITVILLVQPLIRLIILTVVSIPIYVFVTKQQYSLAVKNSESIFRNSKAVKVAVAGSYGKTTVKELINTVLSEGLNVRTTPGNMNTPVAHARFASQLTGEEDVLVIEYGEEHPGDVERFAKTTHPDYGFITGLAPNHLEYYKNMSRLAEDIFSLRNFIEPSKLYISKNSILAKKYLRDGDYTFGSDKAIGWSLSSVKLSISGTEFVMSKGVEKMKLRTGLLGKHLVPVIAAVAVLGLELGLSKHQIIAGVSKTKPFEHRMSPYQLAGAWVIDDTYNGNIEGMIAGLTLLQDLVAKRKIYVTPGLVDQGSQTVEVHYRMAKKIFDTKPDIVVLITNSATAIIDEALEKLGYKGRVQMVSDPLDFYTSLDKVVVPGDLVLMQNDWTDNYN